MNSLTIFGHKSYVVRSSNDQDIPINPEMKQIEQSDNMILMPNDFFDACIIIGYDCLFSDDDHIDIQWLKEAYRVLKPGGFLNVNSVTEIPASDHFILRSMIDDLHSSPQFRFITSDHLKREMAEAGIENYQTFESNGMLLGWGYKY